MRPASVGFQCPGCVGAGRATTRPARTAFGATLTARAGEGTVTKVLIGLVLLVWLAGFVTRGISTEVLALVNFDVAEGQLWRLVTYGFTSAGLLHVLMNCLVLWIAGRPLEQVLGGWRFLALYLLSGIGGATLLFVLGPVTLAAVGGSASVIGLLAANGVLKLRQGQDVRADVGLLILLVLYSLVVGALGYNWLGQVGGILVGGLTGAALAYAPRSRRTLYQMLGMVAVLLLCAAVVTLRLGSLA